MRAGPPLLFAAALAAAPGVRAQEASSVYERHADAVARVEVLEANSRAPAIVGTAFFAAPNILVTNYHVVRDLIYEPDDYDLRLTRARAAAPADPRIIAVDPPNDLALLRVSVEHAEYLRLTTGPVPNGEVLYSLGHPANLQTSVVEGVYNGAVEHAVAPLLHFSGSVNPGMSGGPTVRANGEVVGVNVMTAGNQLSFLIPARQVQDLLDSAASVDRATPEQLREAATGRFTAFQESFFTDLLSGGLSTTSIGTARVPAGPSGPFDCGATPHDVEGDRYRVVEYACFTEDEVLLGRTGFDGLIYMEHIHLASDALNPFAFSALVSSWYTTVFEGEAGPNDEATDYECRNGNVQDGLSTEIVLAFCARRHLPHPGLYDVIVRSAVRGAGREAVVSTLTATPISFGNALALTRSWLRGFGWQGS